MEEKDADIGRILQSLEMKNAINGLLEFAPLVGPGTIISNNIDWLNKFNDAKQNFYKKNYGYSLYLFKELDKELPDYEKFLTPAKINETFCWLYIKKYEEFINIYESRMREGRVYGFIAWNLSIAYYKLEKLDEAEMCLRIGIKSLNSRFLCRALLTLSILEFKNLRDSEAVESFNKAWTTDRNFCIHFIVKFIGEKASEELLSPILKGKIINAQQILSAKEVIIALQSLLVPRPPEKYPQLVQQLSEFEYQHGYIAALEKYGDGNVDDALTLIDKVLKGSEEVYPLYWAKAACLMAKREWKKAIELIEDQMNDPGVPDGIIWNIACAYFNLNSYESALEAIGKCTDRGYRSSALAWIARGLLAHLCGSNDLRDKSIREAINLSPDQIIYYLDTLKQIGFDIEEPFTEEKLQKINTINEEKTPNYENIYLNVRDLLKQGKHIQAAEVFSQVAADSIDNIPEIKKFAFDPIVFPACPRCQEDSKQKFQLGIAAYQRKAYDEALKNFEEIYVKYPENYLAANNLAALLIITERYSQAIEILNEIINNREYGGANAIRNMICAYMRSNKIEEAFSSYNRLIEVSDKEFFDFIQKANIAHLLTRKDDVATALFSACASDLTKPSMSLKGSAVKACLEVKDYDRAVVLVKYFVEEKPLRYAIAGKTKPIKPAIDCRDVVLMQKQYYKFVKRRDPRAALAYFEEVFEARKNDYIKQADYKSADSLFYSCAFYNKSLIWNAEGYKFEEAIKYNLKIIEDNRKYYENADLLQRYSFLIKVFLRAKYFFDALELCKKGLDIESNNKNLLLLRNNIEKQIDEIPQTAREAIKELAELPIIKQNKNDEFIASLPRVNRLMSSISIDYPESKRISKPLEEIVSNLLNIENIVITERKKEIIKLKELIKDLEPKLKSNLPRAIWSAFLPVFKGLKLVLDEYQLKSIIPEFDLSLEPTCYYYENEATLVFRLKNSGSSDIQNLSIKIESNLPSKWSPIIEEKTFDEIKKDDHLWIDWPINLENISGLESDIHPKVVLNYSGGNLKGNSISRIDFQSTELLPFVDLNLNYPIVALKPEENSKLYGRETLLRILKSSFTRFSQTRVPFLEGVRKVGKTSILFFLANRLKDDNLPIYINLEKIWTNFYQLIAKEILDKIDAVNSSEVGRVDKIKDKDDFERFLMRVSVESNIKHIILLIDEFHNLIDRIESGILSKEILGDLRDLYMDPQKKVSVAFADWYQLDEIKSRIPAQLWADFSCERISFLNELDCREAIIIPAQGSNLRFEKNTISRIYYWTNGYPWHIQCLCSDLISYLNVQKRYVAIPQDVDFIAKKLLYQDRLFDEGICKRMNSEDQRLIYLILESLNKLNITPVSGFSREVILQIKINIDKPIVLNRLIQHEILHESGNELKFCSPLHAMWFEAKRLKGLDI